MVARYLSGGDLARWSHNHSLTIARTIELITPIAQALAFAHHHGIIHRDLKPANILLDHREVPLLGDFGLAIRPGRHSRVGWAGSPAYMSPEQIDGRSDLDARSDQFSLGIVIYELVVGERPFRASTWNELAQAIQTARVPASGFRRMGDVLGQLVQRLLARNPADRFDSMDCVERELASMQTAMVRPAPPWPNEGRSTAEVHPVVDSAPWLESLRRNFHGRTRFREQIAQWLSTDDESILLITGEPGIGKTSLMAKVGEWFEPQRLAAYFVQTACPGTLDPRSFAESLRRQVSRRVARDEQGPDPARATRDVTRLEEDLLALFHSVPPRDGGPHLVLIDAVDESLATPEPVTIVALAARLGELLPPGVKLIVTSRPVAGVLAAFAGVRRESIQPEDHDNQSDVRDYLESRLAEYDERTAALAGQSARIAAQIAHKSEGNFLYAVQAVRAIERKLIDPLDLARLPPGLSRLLAGQFETVFRHATNAADCSAILEILVAAGEPVAETLLAESAGIAPETDFLVALHELEPYLRLEVSPTRERQVSLIHSYLTRWLNDGPGSTPGVHVDVKRGHARLADHWLRIWEAGRGDPLLYDKLPKHLLLSDQITTLCDLLVTPRFVQGAADNGTLLCLASPQWSGRWAQAEPAEARFLRRLQAMIFEHASFLELHPGAVGQCILNEFLSDEEDSTGTAVSPSRRIREAWRNERRGWLEQLLPARPAGTAPVDRVFPSGSREFTCLAAEPGEREMAVGTEDGGAVVIHIESGRVRPVGSRSNQPCRALKWQAHNESWIGVWGENELQTFNSSGEVLDYRQVDGLPARFFLPFHEGYIFPGNCGTPRLFDRELRDVADLSGYGARVVAAAASGDHRLIAFAGQHIHGPATLTVFSTYELDRIVRCEPCDTGVQAVCFAGDDRFVIGGGHTGVLRAWRTDNGVLAREWPSIHQPIRFISHCEESGEIVAIGQNGAAIFAKLKDDFKFRSAHLRFAPAGSAALAVTRHTIVAGSSCEVRIWQRAAIEEGKRGHGERITSLCFSSASPMLAVGTSAGEVRRVDAVTRQSVGWTAGTRSRVAAIGIAPSGGRIVAAIGGELVQVELAQPGNPVLRSVGPLEGILAGEADAMDLIAITSDGRQVAYMKRDQTVAVHDTESGRTIATTRIPKPVAMRFIRLNRQPHLVVISDDDSPMGAISWRPLASGGQWRTVAGTPRSITCLESSPDSSWIATGDQSGEIQLWTDRFVPVRRLAEPSGRRGCIDVKFDAAEKQLYALAEDGSVLGFDLGSGPAARELGRHPSRPTCLAVSEDGTRLATGGRDRRVCLWDARTGNGLITIEGHQATVTSIRFLASDRFVLTTSRDGRARLWSAANGSLVSERTISKDWLIDVACAGERCLIISQDGTICSWEPVVDALPAISRYKEHRFVACQWSSETGRLVLLNGQDQVLEWCPETRTLTDRLPAIRRVHALSFVADGVMQIRFSDGSRWVWRIEESRFVPTPHSPPQHGLIVQGSGRDMKITSTGDVDDELFYPGPLERPCISPCRQFVAGLHQDELHLVGVHVHGRTGNDQTL